MNTLNKVMFNEDLCIWVGVEEQSFIVEIEKVNFKKILNEILKYSGPILLLNLAVSFPVTANESNPFKVYKDGKQLENFFEVSNPTLEPHHSYNNDVLKLLSIVSILSNIINNVQISKTQKIVKKSLELNKLKVLENQKVLNNLLMSGGKIAIAVSVSFYAFSILLLIRLANSPEFKDKLKEFESKQIFVFLLQLILLGSSIFLNDIKKIPNALTRMKLQEKIIFLFSEYFDLLIISLLVGGGLLFFIEYGIFPLLFKKYPQLEIFLERYNLRLNDGAITENLKKLQKRIKILETIAIKDKAMIKVASTEALLERTYDKKLYTGMKHEMLRLMNELPVRSRNENYKPSYFYKIHESYRIKQNLLALVYFLIYMNIIQKLEEKFPMIKDLPLNELNKENNSSESF